MKFIPRIIDTTSAVIAKKTKPFVQSWLGKMFLSVVIVGPLTFLPTIYAAWTEPNIDSLRTITWPLMIVVNMSAMLGVIHNGDWRMRLAMFVWILAIATVYIATLVR
mgnify:CR=1 FL=1